MEHRKPLLARAIAMLRASEQWLIDKLGPATELSLMALGHRDKAYELLKAGDHAQALEHATMVIQLHRKSPEGYALRADVYRLDGKAALGIADATQCLRLCPRDNLWLLTHALCSRAEMFLAERESAKAIADATEAISLAGSAAYTARFRGWAHRTRGNGYLQCNDLAAARADFGEAFRLDPTDTYSLRQQAYCDLRRGVPDQAIDKSTQAIRLDPQHAAWCCVVRAEAYLAKGEVDEAIASYTDAIRRDHDYMLAYQCRGNALALKNEYAAAISDFSRVLQLDPTNSSALQARADAEYKGAGDKMAVRCPEK